jgi:hypothetical protein
MKSILLSALVNNPPRMRFDGEDPDEKIILFLRRHPIVSFGQWLSAVFMFFIPFIVSVLMRVDGMGILGLSTIPLRFRIFFWFFWLLISAGYLFELFLMWYFNVNLVTNKRIVDMDFTGLLHSNITEAPLRNVEDITRQIGGAFQVLFNYGNVIIQTAGEQREIEFEYVPDPAYVQDVVSDLVAKKRGRHGN